jgi:hypothetical protein
LKRKFQGLSHKINREVDKMQAFVILILSAVLLLAQSAFGQEIYRSVDAEGNVTYSDQPPTGNQKAEPIELPPPPSAEQIRESEKRNKAIDQAADKAERQRLNQEQSQDEQIAQARKALEEAEAKLAQAKLIQDDDRQSLAAGKRRIRPEYFDRIKAAEAEVEKARKRLLQVRGY